MTTSKFQLFQAGLALKTFSDFGLELGSIYTGLISIRVCLPTGNHEQDNNFEQIGLASANSTLVRFELFQ